MKLLLENWREYLAESNKKIGTLNSDYPGYVELYSPYSENKEPAKVGKWDDEEKKWVDELTAEPLQAEILGSWSDKGTKWLEVDINGTKGWINSTELTLEEVKIWTPSNREELIKYITQFPDQKIHLDSPKGSSKAFGAGKENKVKLTFDYGEYPDIINPADNMGWDIIIVPSATKESKSLKPVGHVSYVEEKEDKAGNDKIIIAPEGWDEENKESDKSTINTFFSKLSQFKDVEWY